MRTAISVENISKLYRLGEINRGMLVDDFFHWCHNLVHGRSESSRGGSLADDPSISERTRKSLFWALQDISFSVEEGEAVGLVGRNGAGKSTLLKLISRITAPSTGEIKFRGRMASMLEVGTGFHPQLTGRDNVYLNGAIMGLSRRDVAAKFDEIVDFSGLGKFMDTPVKRYSSGMYVRLAFSVAAHLEPEILILDEVLAVGDNQFHAQCIERIHQIVAQGRTILVVSHNLSYIRKLSKRVVWLQNGQMVEQGETEDVLTRYEASAVQSRETTHSDEGKAASFRSWKLIDSVSGEPNVVNHPDQPVCIEFEVLSRYQMRKLAMSLSLIAADGAVVWSTEKTGIKLGEGTARLRLHLPWLPLQPGQYRIQVGLKRMEGFLDEWRCEPALLVTSSRESEYGAEGVLQIRSELEVL